MMHTSMLAYFAIIILALGQAQGLTVDDFYKDTSASIVETVSGSSGFAAERNLPVAISNLKGRPEALTKYRFFKGQLLLEQYYIYVLKANRALHDGQATLKISTDAELLQRALGDITGKFSVQPGSVAPTHLILFNNNNIKGSASSTGSTFQFVLATNGNYSYGIIQFVSVEPAASNDEARAQNGYNSPSTLIYEFPYASDKLNAPTNSNVGVPGKYVIDMNENLPPAPPPCNCKARLIKLACEVIRQRSETLPAPCIN